MVRPHAWTENKLLLPTGTRLGPGTTGSQATDGAAYATEIDFLSVLFLRSKIKEPAWLAADRPPCPQVLCKSAGRAPVALPLLRRTPILSNESPAPLTSFNLNDLCKAPAPHTATRGVTQAITNMSKCGRTPSSTYCVTPFPRGSRTREAGLAWPDNGRGGGRGYRVARGGRPDLSGGYTGQKSTELTTEQTNHERFTREN